MNNRYVLYTMLQTEHTLTIDTTTIYIFGLWKHLNQRSKTIGVEAIRRLPTSLLHCHMMEFTQFFSSLHTPWNFVRTFPQWQLLGRWIHGGHYIMAVLRANRTNSRTWKNESYVYWTVHHLDSWIKTDQLDVTCFFILLFNAQRVSGVNTSILRSFASSVL